MWALGTTTFMDAAESYSRVMLGTCGDPRRVHVGTRVGYMLGHFGYGLGWVSGDTFGPMQVCTFVCRIGQWAKLVRGGRRLQLARQVARQLRPQPREAGCDAFSKPQFES